MYDTTPEKVEINEIINNSNDEDIIVDNEESDIAIIYEIEEIVDDKNINKSSQENDVRCKTIYIKKPGVKRNMNFEMQKRTRNIVYEIVDVLTIFLNGILIGAICFILSFLVTVLIRSYFLGHFDN